MHGSRLGVVPEAVKFADDGSTVNHLQTLRAETASRSSRPWSTGAARYGPGRYGGEGRAGKFLRGPFLEESEWVVGSHSEDVPLLGEPSIFGY
jgi:hypothetical protein